MVISRIFHQKIEPSCLQGGVAAKFSPVEQKHEHRKFGFPDAENWGRGLKVFLGGEEERVVYLQKILLSTLTVTKY